MENFKIHFNSLRVWISISLSSCNGQFRQPNVGVRTGIIKMLWAICLLYTEGSGDHILYSFLVFPWYMVQPYLTLSSSANYLWLSHNCGGCIVKAFIFRISEKGRKFPMFYCKKNAHLESLIFTLKFVENWMMRSISVCMCAGCTCVHLCSKQENRQDASPFFLWRSQRKRKVFLCEWKADCMVLSFPLCFNSF